MLHGSDLIQEVATWNVATASWNAPALGIALSRLCSADLPSGSALYDPASGLGFAGRIFLNGEEVSPSQEGRAFAHLMDGTSYELPALGKSSWENLLARPDTGTRTVVVGLDDSSGPVAGQVYVYVGEKSASGNPVEAAGLSNGQLFGIQVAGVAVETSDLQIPDGTRFGLYPFGNVSATTGAAIEAMSVANGVSAFLRPEDGAWDPSNPNDFYFVTTATFSTDSRLWRLRFDDGAAPELGGTITMVLDGSEGHHMFDTVETDTLTAVAQHDAERFVQGASGYLGTRDEESSGIIDVSDILGAGWFLLTVQVPHNVGDTELVAGGQLLALHVPPGRR